ncbi:unnamed protein product [Orchesella dallaii]|uniref:CRAL-TRIO domain-containing protein n=1 Tax=Orchesella dallaii TaxID=48710 RepID=A0ABP1R132_9HEXA
MEIIKNEQDGVAEIRGLIKEFLNGGEGSPKVREYLSSVIDDDSLLLIYLKGRKCRVKHAWETLKRKAEVRFNEYPEVFPETPPESCYQLQKKGGTGVLKERDEFGRRVICFNTVDWDPDEMSIQQLTTTLTFFMDKILMDEDAITNGILMVQNCDQVGWKHAKEYTLPVMLRFLNIFWYAYPFKFEGLYYFNCPSYVRYIFNMMKPFLPKKIKERLIISTKDKKFDLLHTKLSPKILPKFLGGDLGNHDALEFEFLPPMK